MSLDALVQVWPRVKLAAIEEYRQRLLSTASYLHQMGLQLQKENPILYRFIEQSSEVSPQAYSLCMATLLTSYCLSAIQRELDEQRTEKETSGVVDVPTYAPYVVSAVNDTFPYALPRVTTDTIEEYERRIERPEYYDALTTHLQIDNPTLLSTAFMMDAETASERAAYLAVLVQTYALLSIQYELDMKTPKN